jgi:hypothetical protein
MKIFFLLIISFIIFQSCGKKSNPEYQGKIKKEIIRLS